MRVFHRCSNPIKKKKICLQSTKTYNVFVCFKKGRISLLVVFNSNEMHFWTISAPTRSKSTFV